MAQTPIPPQNLPPPGTHRVIGLVLVSSGRALDVALVESDGCDHVRRIELERVLLRAGAVEEAVVAAVLAFMGDRALQPFAVDCLALAVGMPAAVATALRRDVGVWTGVVAPGRQWPQLPEAERVALVGVVQYRAE